MRPIAAIHIGGRRISVNDPPYIIAEIGVNHDGKPELALELTRIAHAAGAEAIKLQLFEADRLMGKAAKLAAYQRAAGESDPIEMLRRLELTIDQMAPVVALAHELGLHALVSIFSVELVPLAQQLAWDGYKTASPDIINKPLLDALAATGKPLVVSTGASTIDEVVRAAKWLESAGARLCMLQCVSSYPTPIEQMALGGIEAICRATGVLTGYSDHTSLIEGGALAVGGRALMLEKHLTYDRAAKGPDHAASLDGDGFRAYCVAALGRYVGGGPQVAHERAKRVLDIEQDVRLVSRQSLTSVRNLPAGHTLTRDDLTIKRPGTGIVPFEMDAAVGRVLVAAVEADMPISWDQIRPCQ